jgi:hypothetical protein
MAVNDCSILTLKISVKITAVIYRSIVFITLAPGLIIIKLFTTVIYEVSIKLDFCPWQACPA